MYICLSFSLAREWMDAVLTTIRSPILWVFCFFNHIIHQICRGGCWQIRHIIWLHMAELVKTIYHVRSTLAISKLILSLFLQYHVFMENYFCVLHLLTLARFWSLCFLWDYTSDDAITSTSRTWLQLISTCELHGLTSILLTYLTVFTEICMTYILDIFTSREL